MFFLEFVITHISLGIFHQLLIPVFLNIFQLSYIVPDHHQLLVDMIVVRFGLQDILIIFDIFLCFDLIDMIDGGDIMFEFTFMTISTFPMFMTL